MKLIKILSLSIVLSLASFVSLVSSATGLRVPENKVYTLYRGSSTSRGARIHVATFDANEKAYYNKGNCEIAQDLFQSQKGVKVKYWCERGYFSK